MSLEIAAFGPNSIPTLGISGELQLFDQLDGCELGPGQDRVRGKIAVVRRGKCTFLEKVRNAQASGAIAVVVADNDPFTDGKVRMTGNPGGDDDVKIISGLMSFGPGQILIDYLKREASNFGMEEEEEEVEEEMVERSSAKTRMSDRLPPLVCRIFPIQASTVSPTKGFSDVTKSQLNPQNEGLKVASQLELLRSVEKELTQTIIVSQHKSKKKQEKEND